MRTATLFLIVLFASAWPQLAVSQVTNDLTEQKIAGKVKSITEYNFNVKRVHGKIQKEYTGKTRTVFNQSGNKDNDYTYKADGSLETSTVFNYNKEGVLEQEDGYNGNSPEYTNIYKSDKDGNFTLIKLFDGAGKLFLKTVCDYDKNGNETAEINYTQVMERDKLRDAVLDKTVWQYDKDGNKTKEQYLEGDSAVIRTTYFTYDASGNITTRINSENGFKLKTAYKYDGKGNQVEETQFDATGKVATRILTGYDEKGNITEQTFFDKDDRLETHIVFSLTYDQQGNWIRKVQTNNNKQVGITDREIVYY
jgi:YD repeat-containing protein